MHIDEIGVAWRSQAGCCADTLNGSRGARLTMTPPSGHEPQPIIFIFIYFLNIYIYIYLLSIDIFHIYIYIYIHIYIMHIYFIIIIFSIIEFGHWRSRPIYE